MGNYSKYYVFEQQKNPLLWNLPRRTLYENYEMRSVEGLPSEVVDHGFICCVINDTLAAMLEGAVAQDLCEDYG